MKPHLFQINLTNGIVLCLLSFCMIAAINLYN